MFSEKIKYKNSEYFFPRFSYILSNRFTKNLNENKSKNSKSRNGILINFERTSNTKRVSLKNKSKWIERSESCFYNETMNEKSYLIIQV